MELLDFAQAFVGQSDLRMMAVMKMKDHLLKKGYLLGWIVKVYQFTASRAVEGLASSQLPPSVDQILPASQADLEKVFAYGADMLGSSQTCKLLLAAWLSHLQESSWVAIDNKGEVVGYLIISEIAGFPEKGYSIAPFFADNAPIAYSLLKVAAEFASANSPCKTYCNIVMDIPVDFNPKGVCILESTIGAKPIEENIFMSNKELPTAQLSKCSALLVLKFCEIEKCRADGLIIILY